MSDIAALFARAVAEQRESRLTEAEALYREILAADAGVVEARFNLGFALQMQGRLADAAAAYREVLRLRPDFAHAHAKLGDVMHWVGHLGPAIHHYETAGTIAPDDAAVRAGAEHIRGLAAKRQEILDRRDDEGRIDLSDVTFMIPCRLESDDRRRNLRVLLSYLRKYLKTNIIICEDDPAGSGVPDVAARAGLEPGSYQYIHISQNDTGFTHKAKQINMMAEVARTPILVVQDTDVVVEPTQYVFARDAVRAGAAMACPFNGLFFDVGADYVACVDRHLSVAMVDLFDPRNELLYKNSYAGSVFFHHEVFSRFGGFNENFISWGWEDFEIYRRLEWLGLRVERQWGPAMHLSHSRATNSLKENPWFAHNTRVYDRINAMDRDGILADVAAGRFRRPLITNAGLAELAAAPSGGAPAGSDSGASA